VPFFSIIIPTYNRSKIIDNTIQSVINQQFTDWELIIIDDGGNDNTENVIKDFNDSRIKYFWKENGERGAARNYGTKQATGEYMFYLDSDDLIYSNHLQHAFEQLTKLNFPEFFHSRYEEVYPNKTVQVELLNQEQIWTTIQQQNKMACQFFLRHDIAIQFPFSENRHLKIGEDWLVILQIGIHHKLNISNKVNSAIVQHQNRSMQIASFKDVTTSKVLIIEALEKTNSKNINTILSNVNYELTSLAALSATLNTEKWLGLKTLTLLLLKNPIKVVTQRRTLAIIKHLLT